MRIPKYRCTVDGYGFSEWRRKRYYFPGKYNSPTSKSAYKRFIRDVVGVEDDELSPLIVEPGRSVSIREAALAYIRVADSWRDARGRQVAERYHVRSAMRVLYKAFGELAMHDFGPKSLVAVRAKMLATNKVRLQKATVDGVERVVATDTGVPITRTYANEQVGRIKRFLSWAVAQELIPAAVCDALKHTEPLRASRSRGKGEKPLREGQRVRPAPPEAVNAVRGKVSPTVRAMIDLHELTGMRPEELCIMRPMDIDRSSDVWEYRPGFSKTDEYLAGNGLERVIYLGPKAQAAIEPLLDRLADAYLFDPRESMKWYRDQRWTNSKAARTGPTKTARKVGDVYTPAAYRRAIARAAKLAGAVHWFPYQLRHSHGTEVRKKYKLEGAQVALGHARADVTQIYAEKNHELARKIAAEMG